MTKGEQSGESHDTGTPEMDETRTEPAATGAGPTTEAVPPPVDVPRRRTSKVVAGAAAIGVIGLLVGGGVGYAVGHRSGGSTDAKGSTATLSLPSTLPGGWQRSTQADSQIKPSVSSARSTLGAGTDMALYTHGKTQMLVEATRLPGQALLQAGMSYSKMGGAVCGSGTTGQATAAVCSRSSDVLTVKVTAGDPTDASKYADDIFGSLT